VVETSSNHCFINQHTVVGRFDVEVASRSSRESLRRHAIRQLTDKLAVSVRSQKFADQVFPFRVAVPQPR
jgi:hypothetical protein